VPLPAQTNNASLLPKIMGILPAMLIWSMASAQFFGWPSHSGTLDPAHDVNSSGVSTLTVASNTTVYADSNRVRVTGSTFLGGVDYMLDVSAPAGVLLSDLDFPVNKWCFMAQMEDPSALYKVGTNTRVEVVSFDPGLGKLHVRKPAGSISVTPASFDYATNAVVQLIRVPVYRNLYLEPQGVLTCHPYNHADGTGGVLPFIASYVYFNGGIINASGKGYHVGGNYTLGQGTAGAPAATGTLGAGWPPGPYPYANVTPHTSFGNPPPTDLNPAMNGYLCGDPAGVMNDFDISNMLPGNSGNGANNTAAGANTTSGTIDTYDPPTSPLTSSAWGTIRMGNAGLPGNDGATGGGGGGTGGEGGMNGLPGIPGPGLAGYAGATGGNAGDAARGGGIIIFKLKEFTPASGLSSNQKFIYSNGEHGKRGGNGGRGGDGGDGGLGIDGGCDLSTNQIIPPGAIGGYGLSGIGGDGAQGGSAGNSGSIWLMKKTSSSLGSRVSLRGGFGGPGGRGGYSKKYYTLPLAFNWEAPGLALLTCNGFGREYEYCLPVPPCPPIEVCDCEEVFAQLERIKTPTTFQNTTYPYSLTSGSYAPVFYDNNYYNSGVRALYYTDNSTAPCPITYKCIMYRQNLFESMVMKLYKTKELDGSPGMVGFNTITRPSLGSNIVNLDYVISPTTWKGLKFTGGAVDVLEDLDDPSKPIVYGSNCRYTYKSGGGGGGGSGGPTEPPFKRDGLSFEDKTGDDGDNGSDGTDNTGDPDWYEENDNAPRIDMGGGSGSGFIETTDLILLSGNVVSGIPQVVTLANPEVPASYVLLDMQGKVVAEGTIETSIKLPHVARGTYVLRVMQGQAIDIKKIQL